MGHAAAVSWRCAHVSLNCIWRRDPALALRQFHEQIGEVDIGPEPHQQVLAAIAPSSTAALAFNAGDDMRKLAERKKPFRIPELVDGI